MEDRIKAEQWLYLLLVFTLPFARLVEFTLFGATLQLADLLFLAAALVWVIAFAARRAKFRWSWFYLCLAAYALACILSTIASDDPQHSAVKLAGKFYLIGVAFLTFNIVTSARMLKQVLRAWILGACIAVLLSLLGIVFFYAGLKDPSQNIVVHYGFGSLPSGNYPRTEGFFSYPAIFCNFLSVTWMFALALRSNEWLSERIFWIFGVALFIVDAFTLTPGLGGLFLATGIFLRNRSQNGAKEFWGRSAQFSGVLIAAIFLFVTSITLFSYDPVATRVPLMDLDISTSVRVRAWSTALQTFTRDPILGRGVGMPVANAEFTDPTGAEHLLTDAHNTYLSVLGETGLVGFLAFMSIIGFVTVSLLKRRPKGGYFEAIRLCLLLAMLDAFFYQSLTGSYEDTRHLWVLFGMAAAFGRAEDNAQLTMHNAE
jgi:O-antigen ligase